MAEKEQWRGRSVFSGRLVEAVFLRPTWLFSSELELGVSVSLGLAADSLSALSVASWLQGRSLSLVARILYPTGTGFPASTTTPWAFVGQILNITCMKHCCGSRALAGLVEDIALDSKTFAGLVQGIAMESSTRLNSSGLEYVDRTLAVLCT